MPHLAHIERLEFRRHFAAGPYLESGGQVVIEAEHYDATIARGGKSWSATKSPAGFAADGAMIAQPNTGTQINTNIATTSPELRYSVKFSTTGIYRVWLRANMPDGDANSAHVGLDGVVSATADRMSGALTTSTPWRWFDNTMDGPVATLNITTAGTHTINVWMREDGFVLDRLLLTLNTSLTPLGVGPAESARETASTPPPINTIASLDPELDSPWNIRRLTNSGERGAWSPDGKKIAYIGTMFGDAYEIDVATGQTRLLTGFFAHKGFIRVDYLPDGNFLLTGAKTFADAQYTRYHDEELWVMPKDLSEPPVALNQKVNEGVAISRIAAGNHIAWTNNSNQYPSQFPSGGNAMYTGDIVYTNGVPTLVNKKRVCFDAEYIDVQDFRDADRELIFSRYLNNRASVLGVRLDTGVVKTYRTSLVEYNEAEGIFPGGAADVVESSRDKGMDKQNPQYIDLWQLSLSGDGAPFKRLTRWGDFAGYKSSNPVVSPDGRYVAFQSARSGETAGIGHGIFILDLKSTPANGQMFYTDSFSATDGTLALTTTTNSITRTIDTSGFKNISLNLSAFQSAATFEAADKLKIEVDTGAGFVRLLTDGQGFQGIDNATGDEAASMIGTTSAKATGWLALQGSASNNKSLKIRITGIVSSADEKYFLDALQLTGTSIT